MPKYAFHYPGIACTDVRLYLPHGLMRRASGAEPVTSRSRARSSRMHHASYPVFVHRPAALDSASFRPCLTTTPLPFS